MRHADLHCVHSGQYCGAWLWLVSTQLMIRGGGVIVTLYTSCSDVNLCNNVMTGCWWG
jgi:hypothetical protein